MRLTQSANVNVMSAEKNLQGEQESYQLPPEMRPGTFYENVRKRSVRVGGKLALGTNVSMCVGWAAEFMRQLVL